MTQRPIDHYAETAWGIAPDRHLWRREKIAIELIERSARPGYRILDVGCGNGYFLGELAARNSGRELELRGVDGSEYQVAHPAAGSPELTCADIEDGLPFGDGQFDLVYVEARKT